jgi:hypothetical protein
MNQKQKNKLLGDEGEAVAKLAFVRLGWEIYIGSGNSFYDFLAHKDNKVRRIEVKATTVRNKSDTGWVFDIRRSYDNIPFDKNTLDYLCCFIGPLSQLIIVDAKTVKQKREFLILDKDVLNGVYQKIRIK